METLSTNCFQAVQPDTGQVGVGIGSPPPAKSETPKIEITGTDPLCQGPLSPCDVALAEWEADFSHADNNNCGDYRGGGGGGRKSEGGPGKCPSPSRNSPRRHSPVPYAPSNRHRTSRPPASSSDDVEGGNLSPLRQPFSPSSPTHNRQRPSSLQLNSTSSSASEEFICVSFSDPFCSPTIATTSDAILAITINGDDHDDKDNDVEMEFAHPSDDDDVDFQTTSKPRVAPDSTHSSDDYRTFDSASGGDASHGNPHDNDHVNGDILVPGKAHTHVSATLPNKENGGCRSNSALVPVTCGGSDSVNFSAPTFSTAPNSDAFDSLPVLAATDVSEMTSEAMDGEEECFNDADVYSSDESSDDDMEDLLPPAALVPAVNCFEEGVTYQSDVMGCHSDVMACHSDVAREGPCSTCRQRLVITDSERCSCGLASSNITEITDSDSRVPGDGGSGWHTCAGAPGSICLQQQQEKNWHSHRPYCLLAGSSSPIRRASYPNFPPASANSSDGYSRSACTTAETSPSRSLSQSDRRRTPEDFALWRVVGLPPLHFPHGHGVLLVHEALPSPYDPDLPTPPIILTPYTSYDDLRTRKGSSGSNNNNNDDDDGELSVLKTVGAGKAMSGCPHTFVSHCHHTTACEGVGDRCGWWNSDADKDRPDIARSKSSPNLNSQGGAGVVGMETAHRFQEPYQPCAHLGTAHHPGACYRRNSSCGELSSGRCAADLDPALPCSCSEWQISVGDPFPINSRSHSLPGSLCNGRAAVIGRLRRVVERRLSSTQDS